jgi:glycosyltransferase involved in cell wall biosynthesis
MPRLLIDATMLSREPKGVGRYAYHLCLEVTARLEPDWQVDMIVFDHDVPDFPQDFRAVFHVMPYASDLVRGLFRVPAFIKRLKPDVLLRPNDSCGRDYHVPSITVCHGINSLIDRAGGVQRGLGEQGLFSVKQFFIRRGLRSSKIVICNSAYLKRAVIEHYDIPAERTAIGYCGVDPRFYEMAVKVDRDQVRHRYGVSNYILTFATGDRHEGAERLPAILKALRDCDIPITLLIAGIKREAPYVKGLEQAFGNLSLQRGRDYVFESFLGESQFGELVGLYRAADFYLELSKHESFGMQLAEAMACGTTCISSGADGLAEVGDRFAIPMDARTAEGVARAVAGAYRDRLHERDNHPQIEFTRRFNWQAVGELVSRQIERLGRHMEGQSA